MPGTISSKLVPKEVLFPRSQKEALSYIFHDLILDFFLDLKDGLNP